MRTGNLTPFKPGQSGNPGGRPKDRLRPLLLAEAAKLVKRGKVEMTQGQALAENLFRLALSRGMVAVPAAKLILEHIDGKPVQALDVSGEIEHTHAGLDTARQVLRVVGGNG